jgi:hypothetical protein
VIVDIEPTEDGDPEIVLKSSDGNGDSSEDEQEELLTTA